MMTKLLAAAAALSMVSSPVLAQASTAPPAVQPAAEVVDGNQLHSPGSPIAPILFATIIAFGILLATETWPFDDDDDEDNVPVSP